MGDTAYLSLDGHRVTVSGEGLDFGRPWSTAVTCATRSGQFGLQSGLREGWTEMLRGHHPDFAFDESYNYQNGQLRIGSAGLDDAYGYELTGRRGGHTMWVALWEGARYAVSIIGRYPAPARPDHFAYFNQVVIGEEPDGVVVTARRGGESTEFFGSELTKEVPKLGLLTIVDARAATAMIPSYEGTRVDGGELYVSPDRTFFLLVGDTAVTIIQPFGEDGCGGEMDHPQRLDRAERLVVTWE
ncbi:MAG TPA: hypothetical protein VHI71_05695 [Actinomycetota bacterium]|nr:hypothetical protein [Actinomycetota bacterium]